MASATTHGSGVLTLPFPDKRYLFTEIAEEKSSGACGDDKVDEWMVKDGGSPERITVFRVRAPGKQRKLASLY
jgi:hypothetical protein